MPHVTDVTLPIRIRLIACTEHSIIQDNTSETTEYYCICMPNNFDYGSAASTFWLHSVTMSGQILEILQRILFILV